VVLRSGIVKRLKMMFQVMLKVQAMSLPTLVMLMEMEVKPMDMLVRESVLQTQNNFVSIAGIGKWKMVHQILILLI